MRGCTLFRCALRCWLANSLRSYIDSRLAHAALTSDIFNVMSSCGPLALAFQESTLLQAACFARATALESGQVVTASVSTAGARPHSKLVVDTVHNCIPRISSTSHHLQECGEGCVHFAQSSILSMHCDWPARKLATRRVFPSLSNPYE
jgi:hypothetical protein